MQYRQIRCPTELTNKTGCIRSDEDELLPILTPAKPTRGLSKGSKIAIGVAVPVGVILAAATAIMICLLCRRKIRSNKQHHTESPHGTDQPNQVVGPSLSNVDPAGNTPEQRDGNYSPAVDIAIIEPEPPAYAHELDSDPIKEKPLQITSRSKRLPKKPLELQGDFKSEELEGDDEWLPMMDTPIKDQAEMEGDDTTALPSLRSKFSLSKDSTKNKS